jgi:hypothetical protein
LVEAIRMRLFSWSVAPASAEEKTLYTATNPRCKRAGV